MTTSQLSAVAQPPRQVLLAVNSRPPALHWPRRGNVMPEHQPPLLGVGGDARIELVHKGDQELNTRTHDGLPDAGAWSRSLAQALVEVLYGRRPVGQLTRWVSDEVRSELVFRTRHPAARASIRVGASDSDRTTVVRSVRVQHPQAATAEVAISFALGGRWHAMALRLDALGGRWLCTALQLEPPAQP